MKDNLPTNGIYYNILSTLEGNEPVKVSNSLYLEDSYVN